MRVIFFRIALTALVSCVVLSSSADQSSAQLSWFGKNKVQYHDFEWRILKTPHFDVHFNEGQRTLAARTAVILEHGYQKLSMDFSHDIKWRIPVIVYGSHSDFQQTNVTWSLIPEGVQAFAEPLRKRMVLHFSGSHVDYTHTTIHELVHIFTFDIVYGNLLKSVFSRNMLFHIPLWFAEGLAEYYSSGYDEEVEMFMRDATVFDYLSDLDYTQGYMTYKSGQSAVYYLCDTYGPEKVIEIMDQLRYLRSMERALKNTIGLSTSELSRNWKKSMRRKYWPLYTNKKEPEFHGRRLTDHMRDHHYQNTKPVFSPDGESIAYFSDRKGLDGIYIMNALTGKVEKDLLIGSMSDRFESIRTMRSSLTFNPDGSRIAFVVKSEGMDKLFIMDVHRGKVVDEIRLPLEFFYSPAWSPDGDVIAILGIREGQTDIYLYNLDERSLDQLTDDIADERNPAWFPDGINIAYSRTQRTIVEPEFYPDSSGVERMAGVDFGSLDNVESHDADIWVLDTETGEYSYLIGTDGDDDDPEIIENGSEIIFISDDDGIPNLYRGSLDVGSYYRFTDVLGGIFSPSHSVAKGRLVFTAFSSAGYDLFVMDDFPDKSRVSYSTGGPSMETHAGIEPVGERNLRADEAEVVSDAGFEFPDSTLYRIHGDPDPAGSVERQENVLSSGNVFQEESGDRQGASISGGFPYSVYGDIALDEELDEDAHPDSLKAARERTMKRIGTIQPYNVKFSPDYIGNGMGLFFSTGFGFGLMNQVSFSDLLGDHHLNIAFNIYRSLEDSDLLVSYYYLKKRVDYAIGAFQLKNYLNSRISSVGETFHDYRYFTERNYGLFAIASFPFSMFTRFDMEFQGFVSEREFFEYYSTSYSNYYYYTTGDKSVRRLFQPTLSLVHDSAYFGSFGPVIGSRWMLSVSRTVSFSGSDVSRTTAFVDYRRYTPLFYRNYFAIRLLGGVSEGDDLTYFFLGGPLTMRGYDYLQFSGSRMALLNLEYRYPLIDALIFGWPGRWGIRNIGGTVFFDAGSVWGEGLYIEGNPREVTMEDINDLDYYCDFGVGFYMNLGYLVLNFQLAWPTDFTWTGKSVFHFYIGPQF